MRFAFTGVTSVPRRLDLLAGSGQPVRGGSSGVGERTPSGDGAGLSLDDVRIPVPFRPGPWCILPAHRLHRRGDGAVISLVRLVAKLVKWAVITLAYLLVGLAKVVSIVVVLLFLTGRAGIRRLVDARDHSAEDDGHDEYDLGYPSHVGRSVPSLHGVSRDAFDARWQRERHLRVAERKERRVPSGVRGLSPGGLRPSATGSC